MTIQEASDKHEYDVCMYYTEGLWHWDINGGYSSVGGRNGYADCRECEQELIEFLKTFEPFEK